MVIDRTATCYNGKSRELERKRLRYVIVHRISLEAVHIEDDELDAGLLCRAFADVGELAAVTGGQPPYHFLVRTNGQAEQCLPISARGAHCKGYNAESIAVAVVGDFTKRPPSSHQYQAVVRLCAALSVINRGLIIAGHTDLPGGSSDPDKVCPGELIPISVLIKAVTTTLIDGPLGHKWRTLSGDEINRELARGGINVG